MSDYAPIIGEGTVSGKYSLEQVRRTRDVLARIHAVRRAARFYPFEHPSVGAAIDDLDAVLRAYYDEGADVQLVFLDGEVLLGEQLLTEESVLFDQLGRELSAMGIGAIHFRAGTTRTELVRAMRVVSASTNEIEEAGGVETLTAAARLTSVEIGLVGVIQIGPEERHEISEDARMAFDGAISVIREIHSAIASDAGVAPRRVAGVTKSLVDNVLSDRSAMLQMAGLKSFSEYTYYHSANVAILSVALGSTVTRDPHFLSALGSGALLHDIGKLEVGLDIIEKPGKLDAEEWERVRRHPMLGAKMASQMAGVDSAVLLPILEHHMAWDGSGYPSRTPRRKQHVASRIVAIADSYDAMTSNRSYSAARAQDVAMRVIVESAGSTLDPVLVRLFARMMGAYPPRSVILLSDNRVAVVVAPSEDDPHKPRVRVIANADGTTVTPVEIALDARPELSVLGLIDPATLNIDIDDYL
ncbi:MAG: HD domain-containing protein [Coriobacteriia bacterium]|nr:HD domain-containing protein [Coriobacteriia bacterium]